MAVKRNIVHRPRYKKFESPTAKKVKWIKKAYQRRLDRYLDAMILFGGDFYQLD